MDYSRAGLAACFGPQGSQVTTTMPNATLFNLVEEITALRKQPAANGRSSKVLANTGNLRIILMLLQAGAQLPEHTAAGPVQVQVMKGALRMGVNEERFEVGAGQSLVIEAGARHSVEATEATAVLLTMALPAGAAPGEH